MRADHDGMMLVRADLCDRLESLQKTMQRLTVRDLMQQLGTIRTLALAYGLLPGRRGRRRAFPRRSPPSRAAAPPASISTGCATRSAASGSTTPPSRRCSPRSRCASGPDKGSHFNGSPRHQLRRRPARGLERQDAAASPPCSPSARAGRCSSSPASSSRSLLSNVIAAFAGVYIAEAINVRALTLLVALALLFAGASGLIRRRPPRLATRAPALAHRLHPLPRHRDGRPHPVPDLRSGRPLRQRPARRRRRHRRRPRRLPAGAVARRAAAESGADARASAMPAPRLFLFVGFIAAVQALQLT